VTAAVSIAPNEQAAARRRIKLRPLGLRRRLLLILSLGSMGLSIFLAVTTYGLTRSNVVTQRDEASVEATRRNAQLVTSSLRGNPPNVQDALDALRGFGVQRPLIWYRPSQDWYGGTGRFQATVLPEELVERVVTDAIPARMIIDVAGEANLVVGWPLPDLGAYFEFFSLADLNSTLGSVRLALILAGVITTGLGVMVGVFAAQRSVRPLGAAAQAAKSFASGRLDTRLEVTEDPDLSVLADSFNEMAAALQQRVERDARFASDVSHELRSPLMTLSASVEVMEARRDEMPERARAALDLLSSDVTRFKGLVEDLLEISRFDAGAVRLHLEELLVAEFVRNAVAISSVPTARMTTTQRSESLLIEGDRRRLARVIANLLDNARVHGGVADSGEVTISVQEITDSDGDVYRVQIAVEDCGSGVPVEERSLVFARFARGGSAGRRSSSDGAGLGLALVDEHIRLHGGKVWVEDRLDGSAGARFVIELPAQELTADDLSTEEMAP
jgi:two-component system, OmpR family, sensor histidine kinase MtrB